MCDQERKSQPIICKAQLSDVDYIARHMRDIDRFEIWASHHATPLEALERGLHNSTSCYVVRKDVPIMMFGVAPTSLMSQMGTLWMLSTDELPKVRYRFVRRGPDFIKHFLYDYQMLENYVHVNNKFSLRWLKFCGAHIAEAKPYGKEQELFHYFCFWR